MRSKPPPFVAGLAGLWLALGGVGLNGCQQKKAEPAPEVEAPSTTAPQATSVATTAERDAVPPPSDVAAPPSTAEKWAEGVVTTLLTAGTGQTPPSEVDRVRLNYTGWTRDGKTMISTQTRNRPHTMSMDRLKDGWEGLAVGKMVAGEKRRFWVSAESSRGGLSQRLRNKEPMTFDVELVEVIEVPKPPEVPADVAAPPKDATKTKSGMYHKLLKKGTGSVHPGPEQRVEVHYTGWTTDGKMFDSSVPRGRASTFSLNQVIKGWTEGVQLMVKGEQRRFWIPGELAYGDKPSRPGAPAGMLVFDIELVELR